MQQQEQQYTNKNFFFKCLIKITKHESHDTQ